MKWLQEFVDVGGLDIILEFAKKVELEQDLFNPMERPGLQYHCIESLHAIMNNKAGLDFVSNNVNALISLVVTANSESTKNKTRELALRLLTVACLAEPHGHRYERKTPQTALTQSRGQCSKQAANTAKT
jgi:hypothetical protein